MKPRLRILLAGAILGLPLFPDVSVGQILGARIGVTRLECVFCSVGLQRQLRHMDSVGGWNVNIDEDSVDVFPTEDSQLTAEDLDKAVKATRLAKRDLSIVVRGSLRRMAGKWVLTTGSDKSQQMYLLAEGDKLDSFLKDAGVEKPAPEDSGAAEILHDVVIRGSVDHRTPPGHIDHPYTLTVEAYCLTPRALSFEAERSPDDWKWGTLRKQITAQDGVYGAWLYRERNEVHVVICGDVGPGKVQALLLGAGFRMKTSSREEN